MAITREQAKELLPIIQALVDGKEIQDKIEGVTDWEDTDEINFEYEKIKYRVKPEPTYNTFKIKETCCKETSKHSYLDYIM